MRIAWSQRAINDMLRLRDYIAQDSPYYASQFVERLFHCIDHLSLFPKLGRTVPEAERKELREVIYQGYRVIYRVAVDQIEIITVLHGSRDLTAQSNQFWNDK